LEEETELTLLVNWWLSMGIDLALLGFPVLVKGSSTIEPIYPLCCKRPYWGSRKPQKSLEEPSELSPCLRQHFSRRPPMKTDHSFLVLERLWKTSRTFPATPERPEEAQNLSQRDLRNYSWASLA